jgi:hypothetical protein
MTCNGTICDQRTLVVPYGAESFSTGFVDIAAEEQSQQGLAQVATKLQQAETQSEHLDEQFLRT